MAVKLNVSMIDQEELQRQIMALRDDYSSVTNCTDQFPEWLASGRSHVPPKQQKMLVDYLKNPEKKDAVLNKKIDKHRAKWAAEREKAFEDYVGSHMPQLYQFYVKSFTGHVSFGVPASLNLKILAHEDFRRDITSTLEYKNFCVLSEATDGCILNFSKWNLLINDIVFLAVVHARQNVATYDPVKTLEDSAIWDAKEQRVRVTGREIVILQAAGYQRVAWERMPDEVYFCSSEARSSAPLTLFDVCRAAKGATLAQVKKFVQNPTMRPYIS